jgi:pyruvate/2-oxoglutarate dehydrogenase complex dihydrolipoamide acyltransferase (E2) component
LLEVGDKVNVEIEAPADGELMEVSAKEADCIKFGAVLAVINKPLEPVGRRRNYFDPRAQARWQKPLGRGAVPQRKSHL